MQLTDWPLVEVALLLMVWPISLFTKTIFDPLGRDQSPLLTAIFALFPSAMPLSIIESNSIYLQKSIACWSAS
jgi:hypothetical protein